MKYHITTILLLNTWILFLFQNYLVSNAKTASYQYGLSEWTDQKPETLITEAVRAKFLDFLAQEIPYKLNVQLEYYEEIKEQDKILCAVVVECPNERLLRLIAGAGGGRLQQIKSYVRTDLIDLFKKTVVIDLQLKVKNKTESVAWVLFLNELYLYIYCYGVSKSDKY